MIFKQYFRGFENVWRVVDQDGINEILQLNKNEVNGILFTDKGPGVRPITAPEPRFSLDFLANFPNLLFLRVTRNEFNDIHIINGLSKMEHLYIRSHYSDSLDFSSMSNLNFLNVENSGNLNLGSIHSNNLETISLKYATVSTVKNLPRFSNLKSIEVNYGKLSSLRPILQSPCLEQLSLKNCTPRDNGQELTDQEMRALSNLKLLELYNYRADPNPILSACHNLRRLHLQSCPLFKKLDFLNSMPDLQELILADCKPLESLNPLYKRGWIDRLVISGSTVIESDSLEKLHQVRMRLRPIISHKKHYKLKNSDFHSLPEGYLSFDAYDRLNIFLHEESVRRI